MKVTGKAKVFVNYFSDGYKAWSNKSILIGNKIVTKEDGKETCKNVFTFIPCAIADKIKEKYKKICNDNAIIKKSANGSVIGYNVWINITDGFLTVHGTDSTSPKIMILDVEPCVKDEKEKGLFD